MQEKMKQQVFVFGEPLERLPRDLYIPPEALRILLETFEGPLDLLLYLIRKHNLDILDIPVAMITEQYLAYVEAMKESDIAVVAEYLLMAATLAEIKARMMLPLSPVTEDNDVLEDPRAALAAQLLAYAKNAKAADELAQLPYVGHGTLLSDYAAPIKMVSDSRPEADIGLLHAAVQRVLQRHAWQKAHSVAKEKLSLAKRMNYMLSRLDDEQWYPLTDFYSHDEGKGGLVVSLMAMLELDKLQKLCWRQETSFTPVYIQAKNVTL